MKLCFRPKKFSTEVRAILTQANAIIAEYEAQDLRMTLRQLYYQFVSRDVIPNTEKSYKRLGSIISDGRLAGEIDWDAIEDRARQPQAAPHWSNVREALDARLRSFRLDRWMGQPKRVELWVEKDALAGVLLPIAVRWHITLMVNRGYSSSSAMYESAMRLQEGSSAKQPKIVLYLGDHDPSGEDMVRDVRDRLVLFGVRGLEVTKVALTMDQVRQYDPPPNPAKLTDSRATKYVEEHGDESWEVDAFPPDVLTRIVEAAIREHVHVPRMRLVQREEDAQRNRVNEFLEGLDLDD